MKDAPQRTARPRDGQELRPLADIAFSATIPQRQDGVSAASSRESSQQYIPDRDRYAALVFPLVFDASLSDAAFRTYAALLDSTFNSVTEISLEQLAFKRHKHPATVQRHLAELISANHVRAVRTQGRANEYRLLTQSKYAMGTNGKDAAKPRQDRGVTPSRGAIHTRRPSLDESLRAENEKENDEKGKLAQILERVKRCPRSGNTTAEYEAERLQRRHPKLDFLVIANLDYALENGDPDPLDFADRMTGRGKLAR